MNHVGADVPALVAQQRKARGERIAAAVAAADDQPRRSAFADVDPFKIFADPQSAPLPF